MRIFHLVRSLGYGGLETVVIDLINGSRDRHDCFLGCLIEKGERFNKADVKGSWTGDLGRKSRVRVLFDLYHFLKRNRIDIVHSHNMEPHFYGAITGFAAGVPVVHTKHGRNFPDDLRRVRLNRLLAGFSSRIIAVSKDVAVVAKEIERVPAGKVVVVRNGAGRSPRHETPAGTVQGSLQTTDSGKTFIVGTAGRLSAEKNYPLLIKGFALFCAGLENASETRLLIVGDGSERSDLERLAEKLGIGDRVEFAGMQDEVELFMRRMDVFCLTSRTEGCSVTLLEAGMCGLPAVVTDAGGNREIVVDGETGMVVAQGDETGIAGALEKLYRRPELRREMGEKGRVRVKEEF